MTTTPAAEERFQQIYSRHAGQVLAYFQRRTSPDAAQDCTADTFLVAWRRIDNVPDQALPWLYGVARNVLANHRRSGGRMARLLGRLRSTGPQTAPGPEPEVMRRLADRELADALARMRPADRELLMLSHWEELRHADIGAILGCSAHAVDQRIHRALGRLERELAVTGHKEGGMTTPSARPEGRTP